MAALTFEEYLRLRSSEVKESKHDPGQEYANFKCTFDSWVAKDGRLSQKIAAAAQRPKIPPPTPINSLFEYSLLSGAPESEPNPPIDSFLAKYPASECGTTDFLGGCINSPPLASSALTDVASGPEPVHRGTIMTGKTIGRTEQGWQIEIMNIFHYRYDLLSLPHQAFCPFSKSEGYASGQPPFVKVGLLRYGPEVQLLYGPEVVFEVTMLQKDINLSLRDRHHVLGPISEEMVFHDFSLQDRHLGADHPGSMLGGGWQFSEELEFEPFRPRNAVFMIAQHHRFGIHDHLSLREDVLNEIANLKPEWYADQLRPKQHAIWAEDVSASGFRSISRSHFEKAMELFNQALELDPQHTSAKLGKSMVYGFLNEFQPALACLQQVLEAIFVGEIVLSDLKREALDAIRVLQQLHRRWMDKNRDSRGYRDGSHHTKSGSRDHSRSSGNGGDHIHHFPIAPRFKALLDFQLPNTPTKSSISSSLDMDASSRTQYDGRSGESFSSPPPPSRNNDRPYHRRDSRYDERDRDRDRHDSRYDRYDRYHDDRESRREYSSHGEGSSRHYSGSHRYEDERDGYRRHYRDDERSMGRSGGSYHSSLDRSDHSQSHRPSLPSSSSQQRSTSHSSSSRQPLAQHSQPTGTMRISSNLTVKNRAALSALNYDTLSSGRVEHDPRLDSMILDEPFTPSSQRSSKKRHRDEMSS